MRKPVVGIIANFYLINDQYPAQTSGNMYTEAIAEVAGAVPMIIPSLPDCVDIDEIMGVCDGFLFTGGKPNVHPEIRDIPGRINHRMSPDGTLEDKYAHRHLVQLSSGSPFARMFGFDEVLVNSLHGQGIEKPGPRIIVDGYAPDGTAEAISIKNAPGFALAVQWHPEYNAANDLVSKALFEAFGEALIAWKHKSARAAE